MAKVRITGFGSAFELENELVGIGTDNPTNTLQVLGDTHSLNSQAIGLSTLTTYQGFLETKAVISGASGARSGAVSGEIIIDGDVTVAAGATFTSGPENLTVTDSFTLPGISDNNPTVGTTRFNADIEALEFYTGSEWRTVNAVVDMGTGSRIVIAGGSSNVAPAHNYMSELAYKDLTTLGNYESFGDLGYFVYGAEGACDGTRGLFMAGYASPGDTDRISYITMQSSGTAVDFGNTTVTGRGCLGGGNSSTRGIVGGIGYPSNITINYVEIQTTGNALDFGDLPVSRTTGQGSSSPTRVFFYGGEGSPTVVAEMDFIITATKGDAIDFGDLLTIGRGRAAGGNTVRGVIAGGNNSSRTPQNINTVIYSSLGNATEFGNLTRIRENAAAGTSGTRMVFAGGEAPGLYINVVDFITINTGGQAEDFGDISYSMGDMGCASVTNGGLGGF